MLAMKATAKMSLYCSVATGNMPDLKDKVIEEGKRLPTAVLSMFYGMLEICIITIRELSPSSESLIP